MLGILYGILSFFFPSEPITAPITKVAVIDTGLDLTDPRFKDVLCPSGHKDFTGRGIKDTMGHGTHVAGLIKSYAGNAQYCLIIYKFYAKDSFSFERELEAIKTAIDEGVQIVNISGGGKSFSQEEYDLIKDHSEVTFVVAAGNNGEDLNKEVYYPASYRLPNIVAVGNLAEEQKKNPTSNYGDFVTWEAGTNIISTLPKGQFGSMTGTSMAAPIRTGKLLRFTANYIKLE